MHHAYPLAQLRVSNETQGKVGHEEDAFTILTPVKSFVVEAVDGAEKAEWYSTLEVGAEGPVNGFAGNGFGMLRRRGRMRCWPQSLNPFSPIDPVHTQDQIAFACQLANVPVEGHGLKFAAVWHLDYETTECACCMNGFTVMNRRHHCRACGAVVCGSCSNNKLRLDHIDSEKVGGEVRRLVPPHTTTTTTTTITCLSHPRAHTHNRTRTPTTIHRPSLTTFQPRHIQVRARVRELLRRQQG